MTELFEKKCVPCEGNTAAFDYSEIHKYLKKVNDWEVKQNDQKNYYLEKNFKSKNLLSSQKFGNLVGDIAEKETAIITQDQRILNLSGQIQLLMNELQIVAKALETYEGFEVTSLDI